MSAHAPGRKNNFDALRILAAAAVIYGHASPLTDSPYTVFFGNAIQAFAIKVFFIVSGFLIAQSWMSDPQPFRYLAKRALRIFPALFLCLAVTVLILGPIVTALPLSEYLINPQTWWYALYNAVLYPAYSLPGVFSENPHPNAVNGSLWSLPVEFLMYLIFPLVYAASRLTKTNAILIAFTVVLCVVSIYTLRVAPQQPDFVIYGTAIAPVLDTAPYFFLGAMFSVTRLRKTLDPGVALFLVGILLFLQPSGAAWAETALYLAAPYCILSFATIASPGLSQAGRFGDPSYGIYVYSFPIQQAVVHFIPNVSTIGNTLATLPLAIIAAYISWHLVEKRALAYKPKRKIQAPAANIAVATHMEIT